MKEVLKETEEAIKHNEEQLAAVTKDLKRFCEDVLRDYKSAYIDPECYGNIAIHLTALAVLDEVRRRIVEIGGNEG